MNRVSFTPPTPTPTPISFKLACALHSLSVWGQMYSASKLTSSSAAFCFLFPSLIQMTQIWTVSAEHPDSQSIHCSKESLSGKECEATLNYLLLRYFSACLAQRCSITVVATFEKETCLHRSGVCACDRHVVKSHFSGILRFIIRMTSSKIRSPRQPLSSQMWTWPSPPPAPGSHYHRPLPSEEATGQDVLRSHKLQYLTLKIYFSVNSGVRTSTRGSLDKSGRLREDRLSRKGGKKVLRHTVVSFSSNRTFFVPFKLKNTTR